MTARWGEFEAAMPVMAERGRWLLEQSGRVAFLATVRKSGAPQVRPVMPFIAAGGLYVLIVNMSAKYQDLLREPRYALHMIPAGAENLELHLEGRAEVCADVDEVTRVLAAAGLTAHGFEVLFELRIARAQSTRWDGWGVAPQPEFLRFVAAGSSAPRGLPPTAAGGAS